MRSARGCADQGGAFEAYARMRISGAIIDDLRTRDWMSRRQRKDATAAAETGSGPRPIMLSLDDLSAGTVDRLADDATSALGRPEGGHDSAAPANAVASLPDRGAAGRGRHTIRRRPADRRGGDARRQPAVGLCASQIRARAISALRTVLREAAASDEAVASGEEGGMSLRQRELPSGRALPRGLRER